MAVQFGEWSMPLRDWQKRAFEKWVGSTQTDFLAVATPGAGKTTLALRAIHHMISSGRIRRVVIVCHTDHLKRQWQEAAAKVGIQLDADWDNQSHGAEAKDFHGVCVTYGQVGTKPRWHRRFVDTIPTLVIFDEIHHAGETLVWGDAIREAFSGAVSRLLLSGTPFRTDNNSIPFVTYEDGRSRADFSYGYGDGLRDDVCRPVLFPHYEGKIEWVSGFDVYQACFSDPLEERRANERLRMALSSSGPWLKTVLAEANETLSAVRHTHPDAGGLVVAMERSDARAIAKILEKISGEYPELVLSDVPEASERIKQFARSSQRWIVAVRMVSEGVDIPRLRVGVYASNTLTEMYFRQVVGRFVRSILGLEEQSAHLYIPADVRLIALAQQIKQEREHELREWQAKLRLTGDYGEGMPPMADCTEEPEDTEQHQPRFCEPTNISPAEASGVVFDEQNIDRAELERARQVSQRSGVKIPTNIVAILLHANKELDEGNQPSNSPPPKTFYTVDNTVRPAPILSKQKNALKKRINRMVAQINVITGAPYSHLHKSLRDHTDGNMLEQATLEGLYKRLNVLEKWLKEAQNG